MKAQDAIRHPVALLRTLHSQRSSTCCDDDFSTVSYFKDLIASGAVIPVYTEKTADYIPNQSLVRFRGLVQDMLNPEYYIDEYRCPDGSWRTLRYHDELDDVIADNAETKLNERKPLLVVPVPGESTWVTNFLAAEASRSVARQHTTEEAHKSASKRSRDAHERGMHRSTEGHMQPPSDDHGSIGSGVTLTKRPQNGLDNARSTARATPAPGEENITAASLEAKATLFSNSNIANAYPAGACMLYLYGNADDAIKLNDVVEVVGILSRVPELAAAHMHHHHACTDANANNDAGGAGDEMMLDHRMDADMDEVLETHPPTSQVPRLHVIVLQKEASPFPTHVTATIPAAASALDAADFFATARQRTLGFLSMVLGGDNLAAEYLLLQLVSKVHARAQGNAGSALGALSLNLSGCPNVTLSSDPQKNDAGDKKGALPQQQQSPANTVQNIASMSSMSPFGAAVVAALSALSPRGCGLPLSVPALNAQPWWPRRQPGSVRLTTGPLQLAAGTQLVLDETVLQAGTLNEVGLRNLAALQGIMQSQKVSYDFEFFSLDQPTDCAVTVLSTGRTLLKGVGEVEVPLRGATSGAEGAAAVEAALVAGDAGPARAFLAAVREIEFSIPESVGHVIEKDMAGAKQADAANVNAECFHRWLNVARLLAVSHGERELSVARWGQARDMESKREARIGAKKSE